jgi:NADH-quinone oxidoreductase subunit E
MMGFWLFLWIVVAWALGFSLLGRGGVGTSAIGSSFATRYPPPPATPARSVAPAAAAAVPLMAAPAPAAASEQPLLPPVGDEHKPALLSTPQDGKGDDLELIWGVGPKLAQLLNQLGVYHFSQIASWTELNLRWVDQNLGSFKGRAVRDQWIEQATKLAAGWRPENSIGDKPTG